MAAVRQDVMLAAYAISLGFHIDPASFDDKGMPVGTMAFYKGNSRVWLTARGWRVATMVDGRFPYPPDDGDFFSKLKKALDAAHARSC